MNENPCAPEQGTSVRPNGKRSRPGGDAAFDRDRPLDADLVVVDEASMLDLLLANRLVKAIPPGVAGGQRITARLDDGGSEPDRPASGCECGGARHRAVATAAIDRRVRPDPAVAAIGLID